MLYTLYCKVEIQMEGEDNMKDKLIMIGVLILVIVITLVAHITKPYEIYFATDSSYIINNKKIKKNTKIGELPIPKKIGYIFMYWTVNGERVDENYIARGDTILVAKYELAKENEMITVTFDSDGGSNVDSVKIEKGKTVSEPTVPTKDGYIFSSWTLDGKPYDFNEPVNSNIILKASYIKSNAKTYTVTFDTDGGSKISSKIVEENKVIAKPVNPTKKGYIFKEWQLNGEKYNFSSKIVSDITLKAIYEIDNRKTFIVTFDTDGGSKIANQNVKENDLAKKPTNPTKTGYVFKEWQLNGKLYNFNQKVTNNITLKATYEKLEEKISVSNVTIDKNNSTIEVGSSLKLKVIITPENATNQNVIWKSSDESIAIVDSNGNVTAKKAGNVTITATVDGKSANSKIIVKAPLTYTYELIDVPGSTIGQCNIYIKSSEGKHVNGSLTVVYPNGKSENINIPSTGYLWPNKNTIKEIKNVVAK